MNTVHATVATRPARTESSLRTAVTIIFSVLAALLITAVLFALVFAPTSGDPAPVQVSSDNATKVAFGCPDGADACIQPVTTRPRIPSV